MNIKKITTLMLAIVMIFACFPLATFSASAIAGAGAPTDMDFYVLGIDVSEWQGDSIDYAKLKASGCEYVILRVGFATTIDECFLINYENARAAGMPLGVYLYSHALTREGAAAEAQFCIDLFEQYGMYFEYPIYMDVERTDQLSLSWQETVALCEGWCETLVNAGYFPGIYALLDIMNDLKKDDDFVTTYDLWVPHVGAVEATGSHFTHTSKSYNEDGYGMWQYSWFNLTPDNEYIYDGVYSSGTTKVTALDLDVCYKDYPAIMAEYGYNNCGAPNLAAGKSYTTTTPTRGDEWDDDGVRLTDGKKGSLDGDTAVYSGWNAKSIDITVDLGAGNGDHNTYTLYAAKNLEWGIDTPAALTISGSYDGTNFTELGMTTTVNTESDSSPWSTHTLTVSADASNYRYVKFTVQSNVTHIWIDEVTVSYVGDAVTPDMSLTYQKGYTASGIYADETGNIPYPDESDKSLTDGIAAGASTDYSDSAFVGFNKGTDFYVENGYASVLVDLGARYWIDEFSAYYGTGYNIDVGISAPESIEFYVSDDKTSWYKAGAITVTDDTSVNCAKTALSLDASVAGRYIEYRFIGTSNWIMVAEVSAFEGSENPSFDPNPHKCEGIGDWQSDDTNHWKNCECGEKCDVLAHDEGEWVTTKDAEIGVAGEEALKCTVCGHVLDTRATDELYLIGDVDGNGEINSADYLLIKRHCFESYILTGAEFKRADANADETVDSVDYTLVKRLAFGTYVVA